MAVGSTVESTPGEGAIVRLRLAARRGRRRGRAGRRLVHRPLRDVGSTALATGRDPVGRDPAEPSSPVDRAPAGGDSRPHRILVVDDEPVNRLILSKQLESAGYEVREAADGFQALERLDGVDMMLLDVMMPRMSGYDVCRKVRERLPPTELPILFVSAKGLPEDVTEGLEAGGNDYLVKPVRMQELLARITVHLDLLARYRQLARGET